MTPEERQAEHNRLIKELDPELLEEYYQCERDRRERSYRYRMRTVQMMEDQYIFDDELHKQKLAEWKLQRGKHEEQAARTLLARFARRAAIAKARARGEPAKDPTIEMGEFGHKPRWVAVLAPPEAQITPLDDVAVRPPTGSLSATPSPSRSGPSMATLAWEFQPGPEEGWDGLTETELREYAYKFLERAMGGIMFRELFREHIYDSSVGHLVENVEDPLPPLPEPPGTDLLGDLEFHGPFNPRAKEKDLSRSVSPESVQERSPMRMQGFDGACDLPPLPAGPFHLEDPKKAIAARQTFDMPGYGLPGGLPAVNPNKMFRQHAKTKITKPRQVLPDSGRRQYATKSVDPKNLPAATNQDTDDDSDSDEDKYIPQSIKFGETQRRRLKDRSFRDKVMPKRTFRRMRPWAGARISKEYINEDDLSRLSRFPSTDRAFLPRIALKESAGSASTGKVSKRVKVKAEASRTATPGAPGITAPGITAPGTTAGSEATGLRRNPRRTARKH